MANALESCILLGSSVFSDALLRILDPFLRALSIACDAALIACFCCLCGDSGENMHTAFPIIDIKHLNKM